MLIDFSAPILDPNGKPVAHEEGNWTLGKAAATALFNDLPAERERPLDGESKRKNGDLGLAITSADGPLDLTVEQVANLKVRIGAIHNALFVSRSFALLDPRA